MSSQSLHMTLYATGLNTVLLERPQAYTGPISASTSHGFWAVWVHCFWMLVCSCSISNTGRTLALLNEFTDEGWRIWCIALYKAIRLRVRVGHGSRLRIFELSSTVKLVLHIQARSYRSKDLRRAMASTLYCVPAMLRHAAKQLLTDTETLRYITSSSSRGRHNSRSTDRRSVQP